MRLTTLAATAGLSALAYRLLVEGDLTLDTGYGRRTRPLGLEPVEVAAPRDVVFDVLAAPYGDRVPRALAEKVTVLERGSDMVLAAHRTPAGRGLVTTTVETVRFDRPSRIDFRLVRGPVPFVVESFLLHEAADVTTAAGGPGTRLEYVGELGTDLWALGRWWGERVAGAWERAVAASLASAATEAERRSS